MKEDRTIGINGFGRVGKLLSWQLIATGRYSTIVVNTCTPRVTMGQLANYIEKDSTYGWLNHYLYGNKHLKQLNITINEDDHKIVVDGVTLEFITDVNRPRDIPWQEYDVSVVVDATGQFLDPLAAGESPAGSLRGHLRAGAHKVIVTSPFKLNTGAAYPDDCITAIKGINDADINHENHRLISIASCTTTCLAHMVKPLLENLGSKPILSFSMVTVHALTAAQPALDRIPQADAGEGEKNVAAERFYRSGLNNMILTSTGAAKSLRLVLPEIERIGFIAQSVRVPIDTGSLIIMTVNIQDDSTNRKVINDIYRDAAQRMPYLVYSDKPHVSGDIKGLQAAAMIEGCETHTRTAEAKMKNVGEQGHFMTPITQATIHGWYDNELGNYVYMLCEQLDNIFQNQS
ncbi:MAG: glyceraldehyde-3-phosphate dehydrogenase [Desulfobacterales bacterium]|nr:glyceraldehyde-3-phosphate dehydrogenase [Desulfobacterales bacterium]